MTQNPQKRFDPFVAFLVIACVALAIIAFLLARQNRALKAQLSAKYAAESQPADGLKAGDVIQPFSVNDAVGVKSTVEFGRGEAKTILLVFSSTCPACQQTLPMWKPALGSEIPGTVHVVAVQTDPNSSAPVPMGLPFPIYTLDESATDLLTKVPSVPATVIVDAEGVVTNVWFGVPTTEQKDLLQHALDASKPPAA